MVNFITYNQTNDDIYKYFEDNNLLSMLDESKADSDLFKKYLNKEIPSKKEEISQSSSLKYPKVEMTKLKQLVTPKVESKTEWPYVDSTVPNLVEEATADENKKRFLQEIDNLNLSNEDREYLIKTAQKESSFRPSIKNKFGYLGYYQFGDSALVHTGFTKDDFKDPIKQHLAQLKLRDLNLIPLRKYIGKEINGIQLTPNMLAAMAHLAGASGTKDFLEGTKKSKFAKRGFKDAYGTHITDYMKLFI